MNKARRDLEARIARLSSGQRALLEQRLQGSRVDGHTLLARSLRAAGVTHVYGVPGQPVYETYGALREHGIRTIGTHHQQPGVLMAAAHNYVAGQPVAVTMLSTGVPTTNALTGLVVAQDNCWPLVVLAGTVSRKTAAVSGYFMALPILDIFRPVTKHMICVASSADIPGDIRNALQCAADGRPGPVLVELPGDVMTGMTTPPQKFDTAAGAIDRPAAAAAQVKQASAAIGAAKRPLLMIGKGPRWSASPAALLRLVDEFRIPFVTSPDGAGMLPETHPLCMNALTWTAQEQADLVIVLGARLNWMFRYGNHIAQDAGVLQVDIDPGEIGRNRPATIGIHADAGRFLQQLLDELCQVPAGDRSVARDKRWLQELGERRSRELATREQLATDERERISPLRLAREINAALPADAITIFDGNLSMIACQQLIPATLPASRLTAGTSGCMGVGIPYAIGAKLAQPDRAVVAICGDFAFGLSAMELETAVRHNIAVVIVIANNDGNSGARRQTMHMGGPDTERVMMYQSGLRYDKIMDIFGGHGEVVDEPEQIGPALQRALASRRPACINVRVDPNAPFPKK